VVEDKSRTKVEDKDRGQIGCGIEQRHVKYLNSRHFLL
jgi:hypothetical protein